MLTVAPHRRVGGQAARHALCVGLVVARAVRRGDEWREGDCGRGLEVALSEAGGGRRGHAASREEGRDGGEGEDAHEGLHCMCKLQGKC